MPFAIATSTAYKFHSFSKKLCGKPNRNEKIIIFERLPKSEAE
jgi:hypothetical protein